MDLILAAVVTAATPFLVWLLPFAPLRVLVALPFLLFLPGYLFTAALYPRRQALSALERALLGFGISLAIVPIIGIALSFSPWGLTQPAIVLAVGAFNVAGLLIVWQRRGRPVLAAEASDSWRRLQALAAAPRTHSQTVVAVALVSSALVLVGAIGWRAVQPPRGEEFTEFYVLGADGLLQGYDRALQVGQPQPYSVGIVNHEGTPLTYVVRAYLEDVEVGYAGPVTLGTGEEWDGEVIVTPYAPVEDTTLELFLYQQEDFQRPYRTLRLFVDVAP